jgi:hypothetical protein
VANRTVPGMFQYSPIIAEVTPINEAHTHQGTVGREMERDSSGRRKRSAVCTFPRRGPSPAPSP